MIDSEPTTAIQPARQEGFIIERARLWVTHRFSSERKRSDGRVTKTVALVHYVENGQGEPIDFWDAPSDKSTPDERTDAINEILVELMGQARSHVESYNRTQAYGILARDKGGDPIAQHRFTLAPSVMLDPSRMGGETEPPTPQGALGQTMRFSEALMRILVGTVQTAQERLERINNELAIENRTLRESSYAVAQLREQLLDQSMDRQLKLKDEQRMADRVDKIFGHIDTLIMPLIDKYSPHGPLRSFATSLKPEQIAQIGAVLSDEQRNQLMTILSAGADTEDEATK